MDCYLGELLHRPTAWYKSDNRKPLAEPPIQKRENKKKKQTYIDSNLKDLKVRCSDFTSRRFD